MFIWSDRIDGFEEGIGDVIDTWDETRALVKHRQGRCRGRVEMTTDPTTGVSDVVVAADGYCVVWEEERISKCISQCRGCIRVQRSRVVGIDVVDLIEVHVLHPMNKTDEQHAQKQIKHKIRERQEEAESENAA